MTPSPSEGQALVSNSGPNYGSVNFRIKDQGVHSSVALKANMVDDETLQHLDGGVREGNSLQTWNDSENAENPRNWSLWWKYSIIALVSFIELFT
ncbi:hypothetical protein LTS15_003650, partial [Exophiala xenobiotica]